MNFRLNIELRVAGVEHAHGLSSCSINLSFFHIAVEKVVLRIGWEVLFSLLSRQDCQGGCELCQGIGR